MQHLLQVPGLHPRHDDGPGGRVAVNDVPGDGVEGGQEEGVEADLAIVTDEAHVVTRPSGQQSQQTARVIRCPRGGGTSLPSANMSGGMD